MLRLLVLLFVLALHVPTASAGVASPIEPITEATAPHFIYGGATTSATRAAKLRSPVLNGYDVAGDVSLVRTPVSGAVSAAKGAPRAGASALEDASQAALKAAEGPINISRKHLPGAAGRYNKVRRRA